ncbi:Uncharacterised protein [Mycobacteroides abscessus subsp. abscessus]|nr:Uncharacterised protein [Mycobacteroides abscessus subsp. abscessus]
MALALFSIMTWRNVVLDSEYFCLKSPVDLSKVLLELSSSLALSTLIMTLANSCAAARASREDCSSIRCSS